MSEKQGHLSQTECKPNGTRGVCVNRSALAELCGVSLPTIDAWVRQGMPFLRRADRKNGLEWQFDSAAVIDWIASRRNPYSYRIDRI